MAIVSGSSFKWMIDRWSRVSIILVSDVRWRNQLKYQRESSVVPGVGGYLFHISDFFDIVCELHLISVKPANVWEN